MSWNRKRFRYFHLNGWCRICSLRYKQLLQLSCNFLISDMEGRRGKISTLTAFYQDHFADSLLGLISSNLWKMSHKDIISIRLAIISFISPDQPTLSCSSVRYWFPMKAVSLLQTKWFKKDKLFLHRRAAFPSLLHFNHSYFKPSANIKEGVWGRSQTVTYRSE